MSYQYEVTFTFDLGAALPSVKGLLKQLNDAVANGDTSMPRLKATSRFLSATVTTERELTEEDVDKMKPILLTGVQSRFPGLSVQIESFRRKPGNVQQSAVQ